MVVPDPAPGKLAPSFWLAHLPYSPAPPLEGDHRAQVAVVGAGFTGLWTALELRRRDPTLEVAVLEQGVAGFGASGRNGGFADPSLTHGLANGVRHFPGEVDELERLGRENFAGLVADLEALGIDCDLETSGMLDVATRPHEVAELSEYAELAAAHGLAVELLGPGEVRARLDSPLFLAGLRRPQDGGVLDPGKLVRGLRRAAEALGARVWERTPVLSIARSGPKLELAVPGGRLLSERVVLATNGYSGKLLPASLRRFVPVYDYVLVSEPLTKAQMAAVGWAGREGASDAGNRFHYFRLTADERLLWGGYDAVYHFGNGVGERYDQRRSSGAKLMRHFAATFPQLQDLKFTHSWGGCIATTTRFTPCFGTALGGRLEYVLGYTGLGVVASRFAARVLADRILAPSSPLLRLRWVTEPPFPFPPEPARAAGIFLVGRALERADANGGRRGLLLSALDRLGIGFDS
ncbi:MAG: NAD(P)/FAD-dependent oxidoreductase [Candidatus Dormibacterales bacterium]